MLAFEEIRRHNSSQPYSRTHPTHFYQTRDKYQRVISWNRNNQGSEVATKETEGGGVGGGGSHPFRHPPLLLLMVLLQLLFLSLQRVMVYWTVFLAFWGFRLSTLRLSMSVNSDLRVRRVGGREEQATQPEKNIYRLIERQSQNYT